MLAGLSKNPIIIAYKINNKIIIRLKSFTFFDISSSTFSQTPIFNFKGASHSMQSF